MTTEGQVVERRRLRPVPESARTARQAVLDAVTAVGRPDLADAAGLLVSEIVTNAIVHARTTIDLDVVAGPDGLRVSVRDRSPNQPVPRHYGRAATTGRGLGLVELMSDRHGTDSDGSGGKTIWFELGAVTRGQTLPAPEVRDPAVGEIVVLLQGLPVRLARAWQEHIDALLREHLLAQWDVESPWRDVFPSDGVAAGDAFAVVAAALEALDPETTPYADLVLHLRPDAPGHFAEFDSLVEHMLSLAHRGLTLAPPTQPEIRLLRAWICGEVRSQSADGTPRPWPGLPSEMPPPETSPVGWDSSVVRTASEAVVAADDANRIVAASRAALELLGWDDDLIGRRIAAIIPARLREQHVASFTMHVLTGETRIIGREVTVPALRRDGSEVTIVLAVRRESGGGGRAVFTATLSPVDPPVAGP